MTSNENVIVSCNWDYQEGRDLKKTITLCTEEQIAQYDTDNVQIENCVCFTQKAGSDQKMKLELGVNDKVMTHIEMISEGQVVEIFGSSGEYLSTCHAEFVDEWDGMASYHAKIHLPPVHKCSLQFTRTKEKNRLWIYDIWLATGCTLEPSKSLNFNFDNVNKLIEKSSLGLSKKAEKFKNFFQSYSTNQSASFMDCKSTMPPQMMLKILEGEYMSQLKDYKRSMSNCISNLSGFSISSDTGTSHCLNGSDNTKDDSENKISAVNHKEPLNNAVIDNLKMYIDQKFKVMEDSLLVHIENHFSIMKQEQNEKLDKIFSLLQHDPVKPYAMINQSC